MKKDTKNDLFAKSYKSKQLNGYKLVYSPDHPKALKSGSNKGFVYEHIKVMTDELGRDIKPGEEVHHLDLDKHNNNPENLLLLTSSSHTKLHNWINQGAKFTKPVGNHKVSPKVPTRYCLNPSCNNIVKDKRNVYCSKECLFGDVRAENPGRKITKPDKDTLKEDIENMSMVEVGRKYDVSDNAARKWCKGYGILDHAKNKRS